MKKTAPAARRSTLRSRLPLAAGSPVVVEALEARAMLAADFGRSVVFMADNVPDGDRLAQSFPGAEIVRLSSRTNFFDQVSAALAGRSGLESLHFVTHGSAGSLDVSDGFEQGVDARDLEMRAATVRAWSAALAPEADILLWGCDIGQGAAGRRLVTRLAGLTGADVAASSNITGAGKLGGDWNLEVRHGRVESTADFITPFAYGFALSAPTILGAAAGQAVNENNTIRPFDGVIIGSDVPGSLSISVSLDNAAKGVFTSASLASSGFASAGGGVYTFTGTAAQATAAIALLAFDPTDNRVDTGSTETTTFTISASNGVDAPTTNNTTTVVSTAVNESPVVTGAVAGQAVNDNATLTPFSAVTIADADTPGQTLSVVVALDNAAKGVFTSGSLTSSGFVSAGNGVYTFSGTAAAATTAIRQLVFQPAANRVAVGQTETTSLEISVSDGVGIETCERTTTVVSTSVNTAPSITGASAGQAVSDTSTLNPFSSVSIADADPAQSVTVTVTLDDAAKGTFTAASLASSGFTDAGSGVFTFTGTAAQATVAIRALVFNPSDNRVASGATETTTLALSVTDGVAAPATNSTTTVVSTNVNDAPTITGASAGQTVNDNATVSPFTGVTIADADPSTTLSVSVTIDAAAKGVFTSASLTASGFVDAGGGAYTFTGTAAAATTAIRALVFDPANNRVAVGSTETSTFTISVDDSVAAAVTNNTTTVVSTSVNDAPTITGASAGQTVSDNATLSPFSAVTIADVDSPAQSLSVSVTLDAAAKGIFTSASLTASGFADAGSGVYTFTGTAAQATTAIQQLVFNPADNRVNPTLTETTAFTISVSDGIAAAVTDNTTTVVSTSVNDAPTIGGTSAGQAVDDNATVSPFSTVTISDADAAQSLAVTVTLDSAAKGVFTSASLTASGFADAGAGVYTFTGTAAQAQAAIRALVFNPADNRVPVTTTETTTFTISVNDGIAAAATNNSTTVDSTSINDAPTITGASAGQTVNDNATVSPFTGVTIADADPSQSLLVFVSLDTAAKGVFTPASLTASGFAAAGGGVYTFNGTAAQATTAIRALVFNPTDNRVASGSTETTTFTISADDGDAAAVTDNSTTVVSTNVNDAPTITGASAGQTVNDNATVSPFSAVTIADVDPSTILSVSVTIDSAAKGVFTSASLTASGFVSAGGGVYTFTGTPAQATTAIQALVFDPTNDRVAVASTETSTFTISVDDSVAAAVTDNTTTVVSTNVNDAPTITGASAGQTVNDNATVSPFAGVTIADVDPSTTLSVSVSIDTAAKGVFTSASLTASGFVSAGGGVYTFTGTPAQATAAIQALVFDPTNDRVAVASTETSTFTISVDDSVAAAVTNNTTTVVSTSVNDAPTITGASAGQAVNDNATVSPFSAVTIADVDPSTTVMVSVSIDTAAKGVFTSASLTASGFVSAGGGTYTFTGTPAQATTAIQALVFDPANNRVASGSTETSTFTISVDDSVASAVTNNTTTVVSTNVNDAPTITGASAGQTVNDNATVSPFSAVTIADVDPSTTLSVSVTIDTAAKGVFTSASLTASGFVHAGGGVYTFTGTPAQATTAIQALVFDPTNDRVAVASTETSTFTISVDDSVASAVTNNTTTVVSTSVNDAPTITGASAGQTVNDNATVSPFSAVTIADVDPSTTLSVSVAIDTAAKGVFTSASLTASGFVDAGGGTYTFTGTAAQATTAIQALVFDPANNRVASGSTETSTFTISVDDSVASAVTNNTTTVVSTNVNDAPTITGTSAGQTVNDNATVSPFTGVTIADVDPSTTLSVSVSIDTAAKGVFTSASLSASGFVHAGGGVYTFTGTPAQATTAIQALVFDPTDNRVNPTLTETSTFTISVDDSVAAAVTNNTTTVISTSVNDAPTLTGAAAGQTVNDNATLSPFAGITIADADASQTVMVTIDLDAAAKGAFTSASLTASGFVDVGGGSYTFFGTAAQATTSIRSLVFNPTDNRGAVNSTETTTFTITVDDSIAAAATDSATTVVSTSVNDSATFSGAVAGQVVTDTTTVSPFTAFSIADVDSPDQSLSVSVTLDAAAKGVFTSASLTASGFVSAGGGVYTFTGTAAQATAAIQQLVFQPAENRVNPGSTETTTFSVSVNDGFATSADSTTTVVSTPVNDAPTITGTAAGQAVNDNATVSPFTGVTIADADTNQPLTVSITLDTAAKGVFTSASLTASGFVSAGGGVYTFTGTGAQATTAIRALVFDPTDNRVAPASTETTTFAISVNDGFAAAATNNSTTVISASVNDAPSISGTSAGQAINDTQFVNPFAAVTIADVDAGQSLTITVSLDTAAKGAFTSASLTTSGFVSNGNGSYTFVGSAAQATVAIRALAFDPTDNRVAVGNVETTTFSISVDDGVAAPATNNATTVLSTSVNNATTFSGAAASQAVNDNATLSPFAAFTFADADNPAQALSISVSLDNAAKGAFTAGSLTASGFVSAGGGVYTFTGTAAQATTAIQQLVFQPAANRVNPTLTETTTFTVSANDGFATSTNNTTTVVSTSVNDAATITGTVAGQAVNDGAPIAPASVTVSPFANVTVADADASQIQTFTVTLDDSAKGIFTTSSVAASGFVNSGGGVYTFTGTATQATTALRVLVFNPTNDRVAVGQTETTTFTIAVSDGLGAPVTSNGTTVVSTSINDAPLFSGAVSGQLVNENANVSPFSAAVIFDVDPGQQITVTVTLDSAAKGVFTPASLTATGFVAGAPGTYTYTGLAAEATDALRGLVFDPANNRVAIGQRETTTLTVSVNDGAAPALSSNATTVLSMSINDAPVVNTLAITPGSVVRQSNVTLTASGITDADNAARFVDFYRDSNNNGAYDQGTDLIIGTVAVATGGTATLVVNTTGYAAGNVAFFARSRDALNLAGSATTGTVAITNRAPTLASITRSIDPVVTLGNSITLTANTPSDLDGTINRVEFFRDADNSGTFDANIDTLLGQDTLATGGYTLTVSTASFAVGTNRYFARAIDSDGASSNVVTVTGRINAAPTSAAFASNLSSVARRSSIVLSLTGAADADGTIAGVDFYRDINSNGTFESGTDTLLGTVVTPVSGSYNLTVNTTGYALGANAFLARVRDNNGGTSAFRTTSVTVTNLAPTLASVTTPTPRVVSLGNSLTLLGNTPADLDGTIASVQFFRDADDSGTFDANIDTLLGTDTSAVGGYSVSISTLNFTVGANRVFARSVDNNGDPSNPVSTIVTVNAAPTLASLTSNPSTVNRNSSITLTASGAADSDGTVASVQFFRDTNGNGAFDSGTDALLGTVAAAVAGNRSLLVNTTGYTAGNNFFFARTVDNNGAFGSPQSVQVTINNLNPTLSSVASSIARVLQLGNAVTFTAIGAADLDGTIASVQFFRDADNNGTLDANTDTLLGTDASAVGGFSLLQNTANNGFTVGTNRIFARAFDNNGGVSSVVTSTFVINAAPTIAAIAVNPNPINRAATYTLSADSPADSDGSIIRVEFYRDRSVLGTFESSADLFVGIGTLTSGVWRLTLPGSGLTAGSHTFFARVQDNNGIWSNAVSITVTAA